jgi:AAA domain
VFIQTEDGLGTMEAAHFPLARSFEEVLEALAALYSESHDFATVVVDSVDWLEPLIWTKACRDNGWNSIEDAGFGKGYVACLGLWRQYVDGLNALRDERGMTVVQIAHTDIKRFDSPEHDPYDRYIIKLHGRAAALLLEHSDVVLFANYRISTVKAEVGFNKKVNRALGSGERVVHTAERPAFLAKNRYDLPDALPLHWPSLVQAMPKTLQPLLGAVPGLT